MRKTPGRFHLYKRAEAICDDLRILYAKQHIRSGLSRQPTAEWYGAALRFLTTWGAISRDLLVHNILLERPVSSIITLGQIRRATALETLSTFLLKTAETLISSCIVDDNDSLRDAASTILEGASIDDELDTLLSVMRFEIRQVVANPAYDRICMKGSHSSSEPMTAKEKVATVLFLHHHQTSECKPLKHKEIVEKLKNPRSKKPAVSSGHVTKKLRDIFGNRNWRAEYSRIIRRDGREGILKNLKRHMDNYRPEPSFFGADIELDDLDSDGKVFSDSLRKKQKNNDE